MSMVRACEALSATLHDVCCMRVRGRMAVLGRGAKIIWVPICALGARKGEGNLWARMHVPLTSFKSSHTCKANDACLTLIERRVAELEACKGTV